MLPSALFPELAVSPTAESAAGMLVVTLILGFSIVRQVLTASHSARGRHAVRSLDAALAPLLLAFLVSAATFAWNAMN